MKKKRLSLLKICLAVISFMLSSVTCKGASVFSENEKETITVKGVTFKMVYVKGGTFKMGATSEQGNTFDNDEKSVHQVTLSDYYIGETEVTQELWEVVTGRNPSYFSGSRKLPVEQVSWDACQYFLQKLNMLTGKQFRLLTEAEWEFAARGGTKSKGYKYSGSNYIDEVAWYELNSNSKTHEVGIKAPNELGIYDMSGNVWEWCQDWYDWHGYSSNPQTNPIGPSTGKDRVSRGGSWAYDARYCRVSDRDHGPSYGSSRRMGLRLALDKKDQGEKHEYVDLGLPSGTLWATCNIGASSPEEYGDYFAWGETKGYNSGKTDFDGSTYKWCNGSEETLTKYNNDSDYGHNDNVKELKLEDDAAYVNWGPAWRMPSMEQFEELIDDSYTTSEWIIQKGVEGKKITSKKNGKSIFLSATGCRLGSFLHNAGSYGCYWSRTLRLDFPLGAWLLLFDSRDVNTNNTLRYYGQCVRPVRLSE